MASYSSHKLFAEKADPILQRKRNLMDQMEEDLMLAEEENAQENKKDGGEEPQNLNERDKRIAQNLIHESLVNYPDDYGKKPPLLFRISSKKAKHNWPALSAYLFENGVGKQDGEIYRPYTKGEMAEAGQFINGGKLFEVYSPGEDRRKKQNDKGIDNTISENKTDKIHIPPAAELETADEQKEIPPEAPAAEKEITTVKEVTSPSAESEKKRSDVGGDVIKSDVQGPAPNENPDEIVYEKVEKGKWNNTGYKFKKKSGKPLTAAEVYNFIREEKKKGNKEISETFKVHIKGKDAPGAYPTFEIENPKNKNNKYTAYTFDPDFGKKEEKKSEASAVPDNKTNQPAVVIPQPGFNGIRLHTTASTADGDYKDKKGKAANVYPPGDSLTIIQKGSEKEKGWVKVRTKDGNEGWIEERFVIPVDKGLGKDYTLRYVEPGENVEKILREVEGYERDIGHDNKDAAYVLWRMNEDNPGVYINKKKFDENLVTFKNAIDPVGGELRSVYQSIELKSGTVIKVPTNKGIEKMKAAGKVPTRPGWVNAVVKGGRIVEGLLVGIPVGFGKQAADMVTGLWEMVKSILTGEIIDQLADLFDAIWNMTWDDLVKFLLSMIGVDPDEFKKYWKGGNVTVYDRYEYFGEIIGRILFEVIFAIITGGSALAGKMAELAEKLPVLKKIIEATKIPSTIDPGTINKLKKVERGAEKAEVIPVIGKISKETENLLARFPKLRKELSAVQSKLGNTKFTKFEEQIRKMHPDVLKKLEANPELMENFAKRSLDDPEFFKAMEKGDVSKMDELKDIVKSVRKPTYKIGKSDGGPGTWEKRTTPGKASDIEFQKKVTGAPQDVEYPVKGPNPKGEVKFDGYDPERNVLLDAKRFEDFPKIIKGKILGEKSIIEEAQRQINSYRKGAQIEWHIAGEDQALLIIDLFKKNGITQIKVIYPPKFI